MVLRWRASRARAPLKSFPKMFLKVKEIVKIIISNSDTVVILSKNIKQPSSQA